MKIRAAYFLIILGAFSRPAFTEEISLTATIKSIYTLAGGGIRLQLDNDSSSCTSTTSPDYYTVEVGANSVTTEGLNKIYSNVLAAAATGKSVNIYFDDGTPSCYVNRIKVNF